MTPKRSIVQTALSERSVTGGRELVLAFRLVGQEAVPALLLLPEAAGPHPAALLLHGYSSQKKDMAGSIGRALLARGVGSLAIDLPMHGDRADASQAPSATDPLGWIRTWRQSVADARLAVHYLVARREIDAGRLAVAGYSLGSFLAVALAADEPRLRAVALAAGGDLPEGTALTRVARLAVDPLRAVKELRGRPLLMVHGRRDGTVTPAQAERLYAAAGEPKEIRWLDAGHRLPASASEGAADWLAARLARGEARGRTG